MSLLPGNESLARGRSETLAHLLGLKAVNDGVVDEKWEMALEDQLPYVLGTVIGNHGTHKLKFVCNQQNHTLRGTGLLENSDPEWMLENAAYTKGLYVGKEEVELHTEGKVEQSYAELQFPVSSELAERLSAAPKLRVYFQPYSIPFPWLNSSIRQTESSMQLIKRYFNNCFAGKRE